MTKNLVHPDGIWQSVEIAYAIAYGGVELPWEWRPQYALRNTIYPYILSIPLMIFKNLGIDE